MNKPELITIVSEKTNTTKKQTEEILTAIFETIMETLYQEDKVLITGFGTFEVHERADKTGRNPHTGEELLIKGSKAPVFKAAKVFKEYINR